MQVPIERVWQALNDPQVLARCAPGVKSLEAETPELLHAVLEVAVGPVKGVFKGKIQIADKQEPQAMTLKVEAKAPVGIVSAVGKLRLEATDTGTTVHWEGVPHLAGMLATVGARLVQGVAKSQADLFFQKLQRELQS